MCTLVSVLHCTAIQYSTRFQYGTQYCTTNHRFVSSRFSSGSRGTMGKNTAVFNRTVQHSASESSTME